MARKGKYEEKTKQFKELFLSLDNKGQEAAITVLQSLNFAQSVMCSQMNEENCMSKHQICNSKM